MIGDGKIGPKSDILLLHHLAIYQQQYHGKGDDIMTNLPGVMGM